MTDHQDTTSPKKPSTFLQDWLELDRAFSSGSGDEEIGIGYQLNAHDSFSSNSQGH
jgi:hypothetical protein